MKRKLLSLLMALVAVCGVQKAYAYSTDDLVSNGWTQLESSIADFDVKGKLFVFVDAGSSAYLMADPGNGTRAISKTLADPATDRHYTWLLEGSGSTYALKGADSHFYFNSGSAGWNNYMNVKNDNANYIFTLTDGKYSLKSATTNAFLGPWNDNAAAASDGEGIAANKPETKAPGFYVFYKTIAEYDGKPSDELLTSLKAATPENPVAVTHLLTNSDFSQDITVGWNRQAPCTWFDNTGVDGTRFVEFCDWNAGSWNGAVSQTISGLPNGRYRVKAVGQASSSNVTVTLTANGVSNNLVCIGDQNGNVAVGGQVVAAGSGLAGWQYMEVECQVTDGTLYIIGNASSNAKNRWSNFDYVTIACLEVYDLSSYIALYEEALANAQSAANTDGKFETAVKTALTQTINTYSTVDETSQTALEEAIAALNTATSNLSASVEAYASAKAYLDRMALVLNNTNVYTQEAYNNYYGTWLAEYNAGTLATATAATLNANVAYLDTQYKPANNLDDILLSTWTIGGEQAKNYDKKLYINTWSTEGATDGSDFRAPFFEYWTGDAESLGANTITSTITGLTPSTTYSFTIRARVRQTNDKTKIANGITMQVGSGEVVDISSGTIFGTGPFYIGNFSAVGTTDANGTLTTTITVAASSNISWLSFYNANYAEGEDLSAYIADYEFALANATTALAKGMNPNLREDLQNTVDNYSNVSDTDKAALIAAKEALDAALTAEVRASVAELEGSSVNGWIKTGNTSEFRVNTWSTEGNTDGSNMKTPFLQNWQGKESGSLGDAVMTYTLTDQEKGYYRVSALIRSLNENGGATPAGLFIFANTAIERAYNGTACNNGVYDEPEVYGYVGEDGNLSIGVKIIRGNVNWVSFKNFKVEFVGTELTDAMVGNLTEEAPSFTYNATAQATLDDAVDALETKNAENYVAAGSAIEAAYRERDIDLTGLNTAIAAAEGKVLGFAAGEYAPYNNAEVISALAAAKAIDQGTVADQAIIISATNALTSAEWIANSVEMNAIYDGSFENDYSAMQGNVKPLGWNRTSGSNTGYEVRYITNVPVGATSSNKGMFIKFTANYGSEAGYTMPLKANTVYNLSFLYTGWGNTPTTNILVKDSEGNAVTVYPSSIRPDADGQSDATAWQQYEGVFKTGENDADYILYFDKSEGNQEQIAFGDFKLYTAKEETIDFAISEAGWATLILPFEAVKPGGLTLYSDVAENGEYLTLTEAGDVIEANTPYIVSGAKGEYPLTGISFITQTSYSNTSGNLTGVFADTEIASGYVLQNGTEGVGFYAVVDAIKVKPYRVYVNLSAGVNTRFLLPGDETAIDATAAEDGIVDVYHIGGTLVKSGVKAADALNGLPKGIYVVGGKKVMK